MKTKLKLTDYGHPRYDPALIPGRLTPYDRAEIRAAAAAGAPVNQLANEYRREETTIRRVLHERH